MKINKSFGKKIFSFLSAAVLFFCCTFNVETAFASSQNSDIEKTRLGTSGVYYSYTASDKTLTISGSGATPNFNNSSGTSSSQPWYYWGSDGSVERVVVEEGVTSIGTYFFYRVTAEKFSLPESLVTLYSNSFAATTCKNIEFPSNLKYIYDSAFYLNTSLESIVIPASLKYIGAGAFSNCLSLSSVEFKKMSMELTVSSKAFFGCSALSYIEVPVGASLSSYSLGFKKASVDGTYDDFTMGVYLDSPAYEYASSNYINYVLLDEMQIYEGDSVTREFTDDNLSDEMMFKFVANATTIYTFYSSGDTDVDCILYDENKTVIAESSDNSQMDLNFTVTQTLEEGKTYYYGVKSAGLSGEYTVSLMPVGIKSVSIDWDSEISASTAAKSDFSVLEFIKKKYVIFEYDSGYKVEVSFSNGSEYAGMTMNFDTDSQENITCGENSLSITVGDYTLSFTLTITHSYDETVTDPTVRKDGYSTFTCVLCGDTYVGNYTDHLGFTVTGNLYLYYSPDGTLDKSRPLGGIKIYDGSNNLLATTDKNGYFSADYAYDYIIISNDCGPDRKISVKSDSPSLGNVGLIYGDLNLDGYINAKDYSFAARGYTYDPDYYADNSAMNMDKEKNNYFGLSDVDYYVNFYSFGELTQSSYDDIG